MLRVANLDRSLDFYTRHLGMRLLRKERYPDGQFTLAFLGYGDEDSTTVLELTQLGRPYLHPGECVRSHRVGLQGRGCDL
jgi:lactoylglutathione lyase